MLSPVFSLYSFGAKMLLSDWCAVLLSHKSQTLTRPAWSPRTARIGIRVTIDCRSQSFEIRARRADRTSRRSDPIPLALYRIRQFSNCFCPPNRPALAGQLASARYAVVACQGRVLTFGCGPHHPCPATIDSPGQDRGSGLRPHHSVPSEICISARSESRGVAHRRKEGTKPETSHHKGQIYDQHT